MNIPVYTNKRTIFEEIQHACAQCSTTITASHMNYTPDFDDSFEILLPFLSILDATDPAFNFEQLLGNIAPRMIAHRKILILIANKNDFKKTREYLRKYNYLIGIVCESDIRNRLAGILMIFYDNLHLLMNWELQALTSNSISGIFSLRSVYPAVPFICTTILCLMRRLELIEDPVSDAMNIVLLELITNAIEHGNFNISFNEKRMWLEDHPDISGLIKQKAKDPALQNRATKLAIKIFPTHAHFRIVDEGEGFNWHEIMDRMKSHDTPERHGYGINMAMAHTKNLIYNHKGNSVSFDIDLNRERIKKLRPEYFVNTSHITLQKNEVLINERGGKDTNIYLIATGRLGVYKNDLCVGELRPHDVFCGEIGCLLQIERTAAVIAHSETELVPITPHTFADLLRQHATYGLLLARLLANRLDESNIRRNRAATPAQ